MPVELALRYARISGDTALDDAELTEWRAGVDYYWRAHSLKLQADVGQVSYGANYAALSPKARSGLPALGPRLTNGRALSDTQVRMQFQLAF
jgi:hypothetical protein